MRYILGAVAGLSVIRDVAAQVPLVTNFTAAPWWNTTLYPQEQSANVSHYLSKALQIIPESLNQHVVNFCIRGQIYAPLLHGVDQPGGVPPARPFDSLMFLGDAYVTSWGIHTGDGIVLIDTMNNPSEVQNIISPALASFGYSLYDVKAALITHEHADHYGGARFLQDNYGISVWASNLTWENMPTDPVGPPGLLRPVRNETFTDGQALKLGNTTFNMVATPGHTPGCTSLTFDVYDKGVKHTAGFWGGGGIPATADAKTNQVQSFAKFAKLAKERGVDVLLSNHEDQDDAIYNFDKIAHNATATNPFIVGVDKYQGYLNALAYCVRVQAARSNQTLYA